ncbi:MAG TPA: hypothetical protein DHW42_09605 [Candidatus Marinimicrobia bacterium]|nr:hypothetical protein [Candidatus Neomarinimicrobiota bacterium]
MRRVVTILMMLTVFMLAQEDARIGRDNTHLRKGPGSFYPLIGILQEGANVQIVVKQTAWTKVQCGGMSGWASNNALSGSSKAASGLSSPGIPEDRPTMISRASASGAVRGFAMTYWKKHAGNLEFSDQYDAAFFQPPEYEKFREETYRNRKPEKIRKRYRRIKIENKEPEIDSYLEKLGFAVAGQIAGSGLETNQAQLKYVNMVGNLVLENTPLYYYPFKFYILSDERAVAYAAPNGMIFLSRGLLKIVESEAGLACVLGHEIAHVVQQHGYSEMTKRKTQIVAGDAFDELEEALPDGFSDDELDDLAFQMFEAATSRRQTKYEDEADMLGAIYAYRAGYEPNDLVNVLKSIESMTDRNFWHPESNWQYDAIGDRVERVSAFIEKELDKSPNWNISNRQRFRLVFR